MEYVLLVITGLVAGVLGGLLGIGGSIVMIPAMVWIFGSVVGRPESLHQYQAAAMIVNFVLIAPSVLHHVRAKAVYVSVWRWLAPSALVGVLAGVAASRTGLFTGDNEGYLRMLFGAFLVYVAGYNIYKLNGPSGAGVTRRTAARQAWWKKLGVGGAMGLSAGLLGIGGGSLGVPALQLTLRLPLRNAIATSAVTILSTAWLGAIVKNASLGSDGSIMRSLFLAGVLAPTAIVGSYVGGRLTHSLPLKHVRGAFIALTLVAAWKMIENALETLDVLL